MVQVVGLAATLLAFVAQGRLFAKHAAGLPVARFARFHFSQG